MADQELQPAYEALQKAHAAGDTKSAQKLADYIRTKQSEQEAAKTKANGSASSIAVHPVEAVGEFLGGLHPSKWFEGRDAKDVSAEEAIGAIGGGTAAGAAAGAVLPGALRAGGKAVPGAIGKGMQALGEVLGKVPLKERVVRGAGGGAAMAGVETLGEAMGAAPALNAAAGLVGGGLGETAASFLTKEAGQLLKFVGNASYGNVAGASRALGGMLAPNKPLNEAMARKLQKKLFGDRTEGYVNGLVGSDNRAALQEALRKADPTLTGRGPRSPDEPRPAWAGEADGEMLPMSNSREVAAAGSRGLPPGEGNPLAPPVAIGGPPGAPAAAAPVPGMAAGKAGAAAKRAAAQAEAERLETEAASQALKPASQLYRERMFQGVTEQVRAGKGFSTGPEYAAFEKELQLQVARGKVQPREAQELLRKLRLDRAKGPRAGELHGKYAEDLDDQIRLWGKPQEGAPASGAAAVSSKTSREVRDALRNSYNSYLERSGMGPLEQKYRNAYSQEMIAEAKDKMPRFLFGGLESGAEFTKMARSMSKDPAAKGFLLQSVAKHLANTEPKAVAGEFERLQSAMVTAKMLDPADLKFLREGAAAVKRTAEGKAKERAAMQLQERLMLALARQGGLGAGGAVGAAAADEAEEE